MPYAFTEQGVSMLSTVLRSGIAARISIQIMRAFVAMRRFIFANTGLVQRIDGLELKQIETDKKLDKVFKALDNKEAIPKRGIFFNGQIFDAYALATKIIKSAKQSIILIDNYCLNQNSQNLQDFQNIAASFKKPYLQVLHKMHGYTILLNSLIL